MEPEYAIRLHIPELGFSLVGIQRYKTREDAQKEIGRRIEETTDLDLAVYGEHCACHDGYLELVEPEEAARYPTKS